MDRHDPPDARIDAQAEYRHGPEATRASRLSCARKRRRDRVAKAEDVATQQTQPQSQDWALMSN